VNNAYIIANVAVQSTLALTTFHVFTKVRIFVSYLLDSHKPDTSQDSHKGKQEPEFGFWQHLQASEI
jgi:hypothetical protein